MAVLTRAEMRDLAKFHAKDVSTSQPGLSDDQWNVLLSEALYAYAIEADGDDTLFYAVSATLLTGMNTVDLDFTGLPTPLMLESVFLTGVKRLTKRPLTTILTAQAEDPGARQQPDFYAMSASTGRTVWTLLFEALSDADYPVAALYRMEPTDLLNEDDVPPFGDHASRVIARMAAIEGCLKLGRPGDYMDRLAATLPDRLRAARTSGFRGTTHGGADSGREP